jgi:hypothetical protein
MRWNLKLKSLAVLTLVLAVATALLYFRYPASLPVSAKSPEPWNGNAIAATYVGAQFREVDPANAVLLLSYDLENNTASDYHFADGPGMVVMSRLTSDGSLSSKEDVRLGYATFLPARQRARIELQIRRAFTWPPQWDPALQDKLKDAVNQALADTDEFVLFDQGDRSQIEFPRGWQEFQLASVIKR